MSDPLHELVERPEVDQPVLVVGLDGWIDAGFAANTAVGHLREVMETTLVATWDADVLVDHRSRRPVMHLVEGVNTGSGSCEASTRPAGSFVPCIVPSALYSFMADPVR